MSEDFAALLARLAEMEVAGHADEAAEIAVDHLARAVERFVSILGPERVRRGFATRAKGKALKALDAQALLHGPGGDGELARRAAALAVDMLAPAIGPDAALTLAAEIMRLGAGGSVKSVLAQDVANARGDPQARRNAVGAVRVVAAYWQAAARRGDADAIKCLARLPREGGQELGTRSVVRIEKAMLAWAKADLSDKGWQDARAAWPEVAALAEAAARAGRGESVGPQDFPAANALGPWQALMKLTDPKHADELRGTIRLGFNLKI